MRCPFSRYRRGRERVYACVDGVDAMPCRLHAVDVASRRCCVASMPSIRSASSATPSARPRAHRHTGPERRQNFRTALRHEVHGREHQNFKVRPPHDHDGPGPRRVLRAASLPSSSVRLPPPVRHRHVASMASRRYGTPSPRRRVEKTDRVEVHAIAAPPRAVDAPRASHRSHIKGLLINCLHHFWPSLLEIPGFLRCFITPIVKATSNSKKGPSKTFFTVLIRRPSTPSPRHMYTHRSPSTRPGRTPSVPTRRNSP